MDAVNVFIVMSGVVAILIMAAIGKGRRKSQQYLIVLTGTEIWFVAGIIVWEVSGGAAQIEGTVTEATAEGPSDLLVQVRIDNHTNDPVIGQCTVRAYDPYDISVGARLIASEEMIPPGQSATAKGQISISIGPVSEVVVESC